MLHPPFTPWALPACSCADPKVADVLRRVAALFALSNVVDGHQWHGKVDHSTFVLVEAAVRVAPCHRVTVSPCLVAGVCIQAAKCGSWLLSFAHSLDKCFRC